MQDRVGTHWLARAVVTSGLAILGSGLAHAQQQELDAEPSRVNRAQRVTVPEPRRKKIPASAPSPVAPLAAPSVLDGKWTFGGAIRARIDANFDATNARTGAPDTRSYFGFDTLIVKAAYDSSTLFGAAQYRFYGGAYPYTRESGYKSTFGEFNFLQFAYAGVKLSPEDSISVGLQQVPFGLVPYFSTTFFETVGFVAGLEEVYNTGLKFSHVEKDFNYQLGYFPADGGNYFGISRDASRYSTNVVKADSYVAGGSNNVEQHMLVGRGEYTFFRNEAVTATVGASIWHSSIYNYDTGTYGSKQQEALHFVGTYGPWTLRAIGARVDIDPRNPGGRNSLITIGSYDGSYNLATKAFFFSGDLSYKFTPTVGPFTEIVPYFNYSAYYKDQRAYRDTERYIVGSAWTIRNISGLYVYTEMRIGRNDPYTGAGQYTQGLAAGGDNKFKKSFYVNIGYYF
ncbi:hypothetical protein MMB17_19145 [Methylobacterium organophilum]|uniref:hypothetical protein n=1 Tax=Methylobacterium organophilum TaxID=410 RepID=UPI001F13B8D1|nr:hypothetical protein [Methylobacterium organophilum]UMY16767.1 hypothetical protein MMB17_19145 [Methylobacterium organophilum]